MTSRARRALVPTTAVGIALAAALATAPAFADDNVCIQSYEQTQTLRRAGKLRDARAEAARCASDACPAVLSRDCAKWLTEIDQSIPTVVFEVRSAAGEELTNVRVVEDGKVVAEKIDGKSVTVDIGPHAFRFEPTDGKAATPEEKTVVVHEGDKNRKITVTLGAPAPAGRSAAPPKEERAIPIPVYAFGGAAVLSLGIGSFFAIRGASTESDLERCRPACSPDAVNDASTSYALADILLTAGVVSAIAAVTMFVTRPTTAAPGAASVAARPRRLAFEF